MIKIFPFKVQVKINVFTVIRAEIILSLLIIMKFTVSHLINLGLHINYFIVTYS